MDDCIERINNYLQDENITYPLFVNVENAAQKMEILDYYGVGDNTIVHIADFAKKDSLPNVMGVIDDIKRASGNMFVLELTTYLKLLSGSELQKTMQTLCNMSIAKKVVIVCFHCNEILKKMIQKDLRVAQRIVAADSTVDSVKPHITFVTPEFSFGSANVVEGVEFLPEAIENAVQPEIYIRTAKKASVFANGQYAIATLDTPLQILQNKYPELGGFKYDEAEDSYWRYLLNLSKNKASFRSIVIAHFGNVNNYEYALQEWYTYEDRIQWLLFITMKAFPDAKNQIIRDAVSSSNKHTKVMRNLIRAILNYSQNVKAFSQIYKQWKSLRYRLNIPEEEVADYCEFVDQKGKDALYYLSDLTKMEKEKAIKLIGTYQADYDDETLLGVLKSNFLDFYNYVSPFYFGNDLLDYYFSRYTMQKLRNVIYPEFEKIVNTEAEEQHFVELPTRAEIVSDADKHNSILYFVDALGVEFLNYILQKCAAKGLFAEAKVGKCNLPSITSANKEFVDVFKACDAEIVDFIKKIDKDKHEAIGDYNFEKSEYPIHLIDELAEIDKVVANICTRLSSNKYDQAYIISDHGASRLAVIKKSVLPIESKRTGTHGGRVCEDNELTKKLSHAIHEGGLCILAGYDRFDGSRPSAVETHGGATLEEVVVPVIRVTTDNIVWEFKVMNDGHKVIFSYKTQPVLVIWSKNELNNLSVKVNGKMYVGKQDVDKKTFRFELDKPEKACDCSADIYVSSNCVKRGVKFKLEREGVQKSQKFELGNMMFGGDKKL